MLVKNYITKEEKNNLLIAGGLRKRYLEAYCLEGNHMNKSEIREEILKISSTGEKEIIYLEEMSFGPGSYNNHICECLYIHRKENKIYLISDRNTKMASISLDTWEILPECEAPVKKVYPGEVSWEERLKKGIFLYRNASGGRGNNWHVESAYVAEENILKIMTETPGPVSAGGVITRIEYYKFESHGDLTLWLEQRNEKMFLGEHLKDYNVKKYREPIEGGGGNLLTVYRDGSWIAYCGGSRSGREKESALLIIGFINSMIKRKKIKKESFGRSYWRETQFSCCASIESYRYLSFLDFYQKS